MNLFKNVLVLLMFLFSASPVFSYNIVITTSSEDSRLTDIHDRFVILDNRDLYVEVMARLWLNRSMTERHGKYYFWFMPWELVERPPIEKLDITICETDQPSGDYVYKEECENEIPFKVEKKTDSDYYFTIDLFENFPSVLYMRFNFTLKDHII